METHNSFDMVLASVVGVSFDGRQKYVEQMTHDSPITLKPEPSNAHDANAVAVYTVLAGQEVRIGYLPKKMAAWVQARMNGSECRGRVLDLSSGYDRRGLSIVFYLPTQ